MGIIATFESAQYKKSVEINRVAVRPHVMRLNQVNKPIEVLSTYILYFETG